MLRYFITRHDLPTIETQGATPFTLKSAKPFSGKIIPFSHMYVTSDPYSRRIKKALGEAHVKKFEELNPNQKKAIEAHARFPIDLKAKGFKSVTQLRDFIVDTIGERNHVNILVVNGIGTGFGDNFVGLGALQRLSKLLAPTKVVFHLMQTMNTRVAAAYMRQDNVILHNNCISVTELFAKDFIINLTGMLGMAEFDEMPLAHFQAHTFSINQLVPRTNLHPRLRLDNGKIESLKQVIVQRFNNTQPTVLFHPKASSPVRTMMSSKATELVRSLISQDFNVISAFPYANPTPGFQDLSRYSKSIDDLLHFIAAVDAVVSVGTVVYHLSAALDKPTLLLPTVKADVDSARLLPQVLEWVPPANQDLILNLHKSREEEDLTRAKQIWRNINGMEAVSALKHHMHTFTRGGAAGAATKVGVVIPHFGPQAVLTRCLDSLTQVAGFDPLYLYVVDNNENNRYFTAGVNLGIDQALADGCEYVWLLNNDTQVDGNYLQACLDRFQHNPAVGIVGGKNLKSENPDRIFWGGSHQAFPNGLHKAGYVSKNMLNKATRESWATFSSVMIRAECIRDVGGLDPSMRMIFSDSDFCFSAAMHHWQTWYEPKAVLKHDTGVTNKGANEALLQIFRADKRAFYRKWSKVTGEQDPARLQAAIFQTINFPISN